MIDRSHIPNHLQSPPSPSSPQMERVALKDDVFPFSRLKLEGREPGQEFEGPCWLGKSISLHPPSFPVILPSFHPKLRPSPPLANNQPMYRGHPHPVHPHNHKPPPSAAPLRPILTPSLGHPLNSRMVECPLDVLQWADELYRVENRCALLSPPL